MERLRADMETSAAASVAVEDGTSTVAGATAAPASPARERRGFGEPSSPSVVAGAVAVAGAAGVVRVVAASIFVVRDAIPGVFLIVVVAAEPSDRARDRRPRGWKR